MQRGKLRPHRAPASGLFSNQLASSSHVLNGTGTEKPWGVGMEETAERGIEADGGTTGQVRTETGIGLVTGRRVPLPERMPAAVHPATGQSGRLMVLNAGNGVLGRDMWERS